MTDFITHVWPNRIITVAGAKKKIPPTFSRPWQAHIPEPGTIKCPFHNKNERAAALLTEIDYDGERWFVIDSVYAPEKPHRLIIPDTCWGEAQMRLLGGKEKILTATKLAAMQLALEAAVNQNEPWAFSLQIGPLAAQNLPHCHYHVYKPNIFSPSGASTPSFPTWFQMEAFRNPNFQVFDRKGFRIIAGGQRTGMLYFRPLVTQTFHTKFFGEFADLMSEIIELYAIKFRSSEGLAPDFMFEFEIFRGETTGGVFVPILNQIGTLEHMAMLDPRRGWNLLWSHEETAAYLRS